MSMTWQEAEAAANFPGGKYADHPDAYLAVNQLLADADAEAELEAGL